MPTRITLTILIECPDDAQVRLPGLVPSTCTSDYKAGVQVSPTPGGASHPNPPASEMPQAVLEPPPVPACGDPADPATSDPPKPDALPSGEGGGGAADDVEALRLLLRFGVEDSHKLTAMYKPERIIAACHACERNAARKADTNKPLLNPAGWIKSALRNGWTV